MIHPPPAAATHTSENNNVKAAENAKGTHVDIWVSGDNSGGSHKGVGFSVRNHPGMAFSQSNKLNNFKA